MPNYIGRVIFQNSRTPTIAKVSLYLNTVQLSISPFSCFVSRQLLQRGEPPQRTGFSAPLRFVIPTSQTTVLTPH